MTVPTSPFLAGNYAPVHDEHDGVDCSIAGTLPAGLAGTLYRNGANPRWPPAEPYHWFTGDGMVHAITLSNGRASYCNRWVRTERFRAEEAAGRALFAGFGQPLTPEAESVDTGVANTHVIAHAGRLLALEEAHLPVRLHPATLSTEGGEDFGRLRGRFTAHPKHDPATGQLLFFSYSATGPFSRDMSWGTVEPTGAISTYEVFQAPYCAMVHDFAVTATRVVFPVLPLTGDMDRATSGRPAFAWEPTKGAHLGILDRAAGASSLRWIPAPVCFVFHVMNAFDDGADTVLDVVEYPSAPLFPTASGAPPEPAPSRLVRWRIDPGGAVSRTTLDDLPGEFPRLDERRAGLPYRYGYRICTLPGPDEIAAIVAHDLEARTRTLHALAPGERASEAVFVPRAPDAREGEGWLLSILWHPQTASSTLAILDAARLEAGPVARVSLPRRIPFGFHGSFVPA